MKYEVYAARGYRAEPVEFRHYDGDRRRTLILTDRVPGNGFVLVPKEYYRFLTGNEMDWLTRSAVTINCRWSAENAGAVEKEAGAFLDRLETELEKEASVRRARKSEGESDDGESEGERGT